MYRPAAFREDRIEVMHAHPLAALVTTGESGLIANHLPFLIEDTGTGHGVLRAHMARANDQLEALRSGGEALVIFQGPEAYVTPSWYPSKLEHGKVVPTWNYVAVHAWGTPQLIDNAAWLRGQIERLTASQEGARSPPWTLGDAPADFIASQLRGIIGIEIPISRIEGKWKVSQNRSEADRRGVADGLAAEGAEAMARLVTEGVGS